MVVRVVAAVGVVVAVTLTFAGLSQGRLRATQPPIAFVSDRAGALDVWVADAAGKEQSKFTDSRSDNINPSWSPNGAEIAWASNRSGFWNIYAAKAKGGAVRALTRLKASSSSPSWSPNGQLIAFETNRDGNWEVYVMNADGTKQRNVSKSAADDFRPAWSPDSKRLVYQRTAGTRSVLVVVDVQKPAPQVLPTPQPAFDPVWSPDGRLIAFDAFVQKNYDIWITDPTGELRRRVTTSPAEDAQPTWAPDGSLLAFTSARDGNYEIYESDPFGKQQVNISRTPKANELDPDWAPKAPALAALRRLQNNAPNAGWSCTTPASHVGNDIEGTNNADTLCGGTANELINGNGGNDRIVGKLGADSMRGGVGGDVFWTVDCIKDGLYGGTPTLDTNSGDSSHRDAGLDVEHGIDAHF